MNGKLEKLPIKIMRISGDITLVRADAIITAVNSGRLWCGGIDGAIQRVAGMTYHNVAAKEELSDLKVIVVRGDHNNHKGKFDSVVFVVDDLRSELRNVIAIGLNEADLSGFETISIPAIRTGVMLGAVEKSLEQVVDEYIMGIKRYVSRKIVKGQTPGIKELVFVTYNNPELEEILSKAIFHFVIDYEQKCQECITKEALTNDE